MNSVFRFFMSIVVSVLCLWLAFRTVEWHSVWEQLRQLDLFYVGLFIAFTGLMHICRIVRWYALVRPFVEVTRREVFRMGAIGLMLVMVLPLRLGELARPFLLNRQKAVPFSSGLASVMVERIADGMLMCGLFFGTTVVLSEYSVPPWVDEAAYVALLLFGGMATAIVFSLVANTWVKRSIRLIIEPVSRRLAKKITDLLDAFTVGLQALSNVYAFMNFLIWTTLTWVFDGLAFYFAMRAFGWELPVTAGFTVLCVLIVGIMIPAGPGHLGTFQGALLAGLAIFGISATEAAAYGFVTYPLLLIVIVAFGLPPLFLGRVSTREIIHSRT